MPVARTDVRSAFARIGSRACSISALARRTQSVQTSLRARSDHAYRNNVSLVLPTKSFCHLRTRPRVASSNGYDSCPPCIAFDSQPAVAHGRCISAMHSTPPILMKPIEAAASITYPFGDRDIDAMRAQRTALVARTPAIRSGEVVLWPALSGLQTRVRGCNRLTGWPRTSEGRQALSSSTLTMPDFPACKPIIPD